MKKTKWFCLFILVLTFCFVPFLNGQSLNTTTVSAASRQYDVTEDNIAEYDMDKSLFRVIKKLAIVLNGGYEDGFDFDLFSKQYQVEESDSTDYKNLVADLEEGKLDLTCGTKASYEALTNLAEVEDITGLNCMELDNIKTLIVNDSKIKKIENTDLNSLGNLETLKVENGNLTSFELNPRLLMVDELYLGNNSLTEIDLKSLSSSRKNPIADLSGNKISSVSDIDAPNSGFSALDVSFNNLTNLTDSDLVLLNSKMELGAKPDILLQGVSSFENLEAGDSITVYQSTKIDDLKVVISYRSDSLLYVQNGDNLICQTNATADVEKIKLPAGKILIEFKSGDTLINEINFPSLNQNLLNHLKAKSCNIKLPSPIFEATVNGEKVTDISKEQPSDIKVVFKVDNSKDIPNIEDILYDTYKVNFYSLIQTRNAIYENQDTQTITRNGEYTIKAYVNFDGINSDMIFIEVSRKDMTGITIGLIIIVTIFVLGFSAYFIARWIKSGANVAPLSDKEIFKLNKKKEKYYGKSEDDLILDLDKPRHEERVSDNASDDGNLVENLNEVKKPFDTSVSEDYDSIEVDLGAMPSDIGGEKED